MPNYTHSEIDSPHAIGKYILNCEKYNNDQIFDADLILDSNQGDRFTFNIKARKELIQPKKSEYAKCNAAKNAIVIDGILVHPVKTKWKFAMKLHFIEDGHCREFWYRFDFDHKKFNMTSTDEGMYFSHYEIYDFDECDEDEEGNVDFLCEYPIKVKLKIEMFQNGKIKSAVEPSMNMLMKDLFLDKSMSDCEVKLGENSWSCHSLILGTRSSVFKNHFKDNKIFEIHRKYKVSSPQREQISILLSTSIDYEL